MRSALILLFLLTLALPALATDSGLEINQTCAVQTGCFLGDAAGFPVTIATAGSYRLTGNLLAGDQGGIRLAASDVSLDLNGFTIAGGPTGFMVGIDVVAADNAEVRNGNIRSFGTGVQSVNAGTKGLRLDRLRILDSRGWGILLIGAANARIDFCILKGLGAGFGIQLGNRNELAISHSTITEHNIGLVLSLGSNEVTLLSNVLTANVTQDFITNGQPFVQLGPNQCGTNTTCP